MNVRPYLGIGLACVLSAFTVPASAFESRFKISKSDDLNFGSMVVLTHGTVIIEPSHAGYRTGTAQVVVPSSVRSNSGPAKFTVTCTKAGEDWLKKKGESVQDSNIVTLKYEILPKTPHKLVHRSSANMLLSNFKTFSAKGDLSNEREVSNCNGYSETIYVGATLNVDSSQPPGNYTSSDDITLEVLDTSD